MSSPRKTWLYTQGGVPIPGGPVELTGEEEEAPARLQIDAGNLYEGQRALDGTDIGSKAKFRDYLRRNNYALADDFKETWAKAAKQREELRAGKRRNPALREAIGRLAYALERGRKP